MSEEPKKVTAWGYARAILLECFLLLMAFSSAMAVQRSRWALLDVGLWLLAAYSVRTRRRQMRTAVGE